MRKQDWNYVRWRMMMADSQKVLVITKAYDGVQKDCDEEKYSSNDVLEKDTYGNICSRPKIFLCPGNQKVMCEILVQRS